MRPSLQRLISAAILVGWLAPSVSALGIGLHLASAHHGRDGIDHQRQIADLARAASHGHHHDLNTEPDHHHHARLNGRTLALRLTLSVLAVPPAPSTIAAALAERSPRDRPQRRGPPPPLFTANRSLLL